MALDRLTAIDFWPVWPILCPWESGVKMAQTCPKIDHSKPVQAHFGGICLAPKCPVLRGILGGRNPWPYSRTKMKNVSEEPLLRPGDFAKIKLLILQPHWDFLKPKKSPHPPAAKPQILTWPILSPCLLQVWPFLATFDPKIWSKWPKTGPRFWPRLSQKCQVTNKG